MRNILTYYTYNPEFQNVKLLTKSDRQIYFSIIVLIYTFLVAYSQILTYLTIV